MSSGRLPSWQPAPSQRRVPEDVVYHETASCYFSSSFQFITLSITLASAWTLSSHCSIAGFTAVSHVSSVFIVLDQHHYACSRRGSIYLLLGMKVISALGGLLLLASRVVGEVDPIVIKVSRALLQILSLA